jgi:hypothetical protein
LPLPVGPRIMTLTLVCATRVTMLRSCCIKTVWPVRPRSSVTSRERNSCRAARAVERLPRLVVLYTSGYTENAIVHGGRLDPGVRLISKPYRPEQLSALIRRLLSPVSGAASEDAA